MMAFPDSTLDLRIEAAFGADLNGPWRDWTWTDLSDRLLAHTVTHRRGRSDESSRAQPSSLSFELDTTDGALWPTNPESPFWPNVDRGAIVRASVEGGPPALWLPGQDGSVVTTPHHPDHTITGPIDIRARIQPEAWSSPITWSGGGQVLNQRQRIVGKWDVNDGGAGWLLWLTDDATLAFSWSTDGLGGAWRASTKRSYGLDPQWVGATFTPDDGNGSYRVTFHQYGGEVAPSDINDWEFLSERTGAATTIHPTTATVEVGSRNNQIASYRGRIFAVEVRDGVNGTVVASPRFSESATGAATFTDDQGHVWSVNGDAEITSRVTRFVGTLDELKPVWPYGEQNHPEGSGQQTEARVGLTASGVLRRLAQGSPPLQSTLRRHIAALERRDLTTAYWPCEEEENAAAFSPIVGDGAASPIGAGIKPGSDTTLASSAGLPVIEAGQSGKFDASVPPGIADAEGWAAEMVYKVATPETAPARTRLIAASTRSPNMTYSVYLNSDGFTVEVSNSTGAVVSTASIGPHPDSTSDWFLLRIQAKQDGGSVDWNLSVAGLGSGGSVGVSGSITSTNVGEPRRVTVDTVGPPESGMSFGHITLSNSDSQLGWLAGADTAWIGESAAHRFWRLCREEGIPVEIIGDGVDDESGFRGDRSRSAVMGPQREATLVALLDECAITDGGMILERRGAPGIIYRTGKSLHSQPATVALDAALNQVAAPMNPAYDDQALRNDVTVSASGGGSARAINDTSIDRHGRYDEQITTAGIGGHKTQEAIISDDRNVESAIEHQNRTHAEFRVTRGTWPGMRWPRVSTDLSIAPGIIPDWTSIHPGDRVQVVNLPTQHPGGAVDVIVEGFTEKLSHVNWRGTLNCSPAGPYDSGQLTTDTVTSPTVVGTYAPEDNQTSHTITPSDLTPAPAIGDKVLILTAAVGPSEAATFTWTLPGTVLFEEPGEFFRPRIAGCVVTHTTPGESWVVSASGVFKIVAIALADADQITAGTSFSSTTPTDPPAVTSTPGSLGLAYTALNFTGGTVTNPPDGHTTVIQTPSAARQRYVASTPVEGSTYDPGAATVGPGNEQGTAIAITVAPTVETGEGYRLATDTGDLAAAITATDTTITLTGEPWTTSPDYYPVDLVIGGDGVNNLTGEQVTLLSTSDGNTFTVTRAVNNVSREWPEETTTVLYQPVRTST